MIKIAICEDSEIDQTILKQLIKNMMLEKGVEAEIHIFSSGEELIEAYREDAFHLIFLDILLKNINGIEVGKKIREQDIHVELVYCTSTADFALAAYEVHAMGYLLKPYEPVRISAILDYFIQKNPSLSQKKITITFKRKEYAIAYQDILLVESENKIVKFETIREGVIQSYMKLDEVERELSDVRFLRCHQSYLVNMQYVAGCIGTDFILLNDLMVPIRKSGRKQIIQKFQEYQQRYVEENKRN